LLHVALRPLTFRRAVELYDKAHIERILNKTTGAKTRALPSC